MWQRKFCQKIITGYYQYFFSSNDTCLSLQFWKGFNYTRMVSFFYDYLYVNYGADFFGFSKINEGAFIVLILFGVLSIFALIFLLVTKFELKPNMIFNMWAWDETNLSMFSYYLSIYISKKTYGNGINILLKIVEIVAYCLLLF